MTVEETDDVRLDGKRLRPQGFAPTDDIKIKMAGWFTDGATRSIPAPARLRRRLRF